MDNSLSPKQQKISQELQKIDEKAVQAYRGALKVLGDLENPDRFSQSAHSLREVTALISRKVSIPREIIENKESLKKKIERQFIEKPDLLPSPAEEETRMLVRNWVDLHRFFITITHHKKDVDKEEFFTKLSEFEAILLQFLKPIPVTLEELDSFLSIQSPTQNDVKRLSELLKHPTHVEYFFSRLIWPAWLVPLKERGFFSKLPASIREADYIMFPMWPLSKYLIKISGQKSREVMDIIKGMQETDDFRVHIDLIDCALKMPSSVAKEVIPLAKKWMATPYLTLISEKLGELCLKLSDENEVEFALDLLEALLDVKRQDKESEVLSKEARPHFDLWKYEQILNKVVPIVLQKEQCRVIEVLCSKLSKAIRLERSYKGASFDDLSYIWRPAIENHPQNRDDKDVINLLVVKVRESLETIGKSDEEIFKNCYKLLFKYTSPIFRRIELHLMRLFPDPLTSEIQSSLSHRKVFEDINLWHEYYHLLQEQYSKLPENLKENILKWIEEGPDLERFEKWYKQKRRVPPAKEEKDAHKAHWQIRNLSPLRKIVPQEWKEKWNELVTKYGEPEHPDFHFYTGPVVVGSKSPLTKEEIEKKSPQDVVNYLRTWKPSKAFFAPSKEALGGVISEIVSEYPTNYIETCKEFKTLPPVYIYHLIEGFREAVKKGNAFDWNPVISLCKDVLTTSEPAKISADENSYYDWKSVKKAIAYLLEETLKSKIVSPPFELRETIWELIKTLLQDDEPDLTFEKKHCGENMDPVTLSLNTVRGRAMHVLIHYALWCARCPNLSKHEERMVPEVKEQLEKMLNPKFEPTKTIRAVYGLSLPFLYHLNKDWTEERIPNIFPKDAHRRTLWRVAWEAYVTYCHLYNDIYEKMWEQYGFAINKLDSPKISQRAKEKLSEHLMTAYLRGLEGLESDSLINVFFKKARPEMRGRAISFIGRVLQQLPQNMMRNANQKKVIERIMDLWEWRMEEVKKIDDRARKEFVQELKWFGTWFIHSPFDKTWTISQLCRTLESMGGIIEFADNVIKNLQNYTKEHCSNVVKALTLLVKKDSQGWLLTSSKERIKEIMEFTIREYPPQEIKDSVNELVDNLTRRGYHEFTKFFIK